MNFWVTQLSAMCGSEAAGAVAGKCREPIGSAKAAWLVIFWRAAQKL